MEAGINYLTSEKMSIGAFLIMLSEFFLQGLWFNKLVLHGKAGQLGVVPQIQLL